MRMVDALARSPIEAKAVCPACRGALSREPSDLRCSACSRQYPVVGHVPILVSRSQPYLIETVLVGERQLSLWEDYLRQIRGAMGHEALAFRLPVFRSLSAALEHNLGVGRQLHDAALARIDVRALVQHVARGASGKGDIPTGYGLDAVARYLRADWGGSAQAEIQIAAVEEPVFAQVEKYCDRRGSATMLGAGTGRYLADLGRRFDQVLGVDLSYFFVSAFHHLKSEPIRIFDVVVGRPVSSATITTEVVASMPDAVKAATNVAYVVADATQLPVADQSQDAVVSIYFADVVPWPALLKEVSRILKPGGRFINYGPLDYHSLNLETVLTPEEIKEVVQRFGFRFEEEHWGKMKIFDFDPEGTSHQYRIWSFVTTKLG